MNDKDKEILEWREAARSEAEEVNRLQAENKKLRKALMIYANAKGLVFTDKGLHLKDARNGSSFALQDPAREALKEVGEK
jgi:regulator of replication initiation timing